MGVNFLKNLSTCDIFFLFLGWFLEKMIGLLPLPKNLKYKITYFVNDISKWIRNIDIEVTYDLKTYEKEDFGEEFENIKDLLKSEGFQLKDKRGDSIICSNDEINKRALIEIMPVKRLSDINNDLSTVSIEIQISIDDLKYRDFVLNIIDLITIKNELQTIFFEKYGEFYTESLICKLPNLYKFTGLLSEFKLSSLKGRIENTQIILNSDKIILLGKINKRTIENLKKIIIYYY